jgi:hypothetical protein
VKDVIAILRQARLRFQPLWNRQCKNAVHGSLALGDSDDAAHSFSRTNEPEDDRTSRFQPMIS